MPLYKIIIAVLVIALVVGAILNILFSPIFWILVILILLYSQFKKAAMEKQIEEYNRQKEQEFEEKRKAYDAARDYRKGDGSVIDVEYEEKE